MNEIYQFTKLFLNEGKVVGFSSINKKRVIFHINPLELIEFIQAPKQRTFILDLAFVDKYTDDGMFYPMIISQPSEGKFTAQFQNQQFELVVTSDQSFILIDRSISAAKHDFILLQAPLLTL